MLLTRERCPWVPTSPAQLAAESRLAFEAGACLALAHARADDGGPSREPERFRRLAVAVRERSPLVLASPVGGAGPLADRVAHLPVAQPELGLVPVASLASLEDASFVLGALRQAGVAPLLECQEPAHLSLLATWRQAGLLADPLRPVLRLAGPLGPALEALPPGAIWLAAASGPGHWQVVQEALALGGHVLVGPAEWLRLDGDRQAQSSGELVTRAVALAVALGREPASVEEARQALGLPARPAPP